MFCYQCEQTSKGEGCQTLGVCGKDETTAALQDLLIHAVKGISMYAHRARQLGKADAEIDSFTIHAIFATLTNVNFDPERLVELIHQAVAIRSAAQGIYERASVAAGVVPAELGGAAIWKPAATLDGLLAQSRAALLPARFLAEGKEIANLQELVLYGIKGVAAYAAHALALGAGDPVSFAKIHEALVRNRETVICRVLNAQKAAAVAHDAASRALARLPDWQIAREGWAALEAGLRRVYRTGHRALALAAETSSMENLHEVRKQAKYLWHQLQLVEGVWTGAGKELIDQTHKLSTLLGEDHDLAVLRQTLAADPLSFGGHRVLKAVFAVIDGRREELEKEAFALGFEIYDDPSKIFITRIRAALSYGEKPGGGPNEEGQPDEGPAEGVEPGPAIEGRHRQGQTPPARKRRS